MPRKKPCKRWDGTHRKSDGRPVLKKKYVYRIRYEEVHGPIPAGYVLHHTCENSWCIEVTHLKPITQGEHLRAHGLPGDNCQKFKTHCPQGHPYDEENTYHWGGERICRACRKAHKKKYRDQKKAQTQTC